MDEHGWEYTLSTGYSSVEKNYHLYRRKRWVRRRKLTAAAAAKRASAIKKVTKNDCYLKFACQYRHYVKNLLSSYR